MGVSDPPLSAWCLRMMPGAAPRSLSPPLYIHHYVHHVWCFVYIPHKPLQFSAAGPTTPRYRAGNVLFCHGPCRCVGRCLPTRCTISTPPAALGDFLHAEPCCRQPKRCVPGARSCSDSLKAWCLACGTSPPILDAPCSAVP